VQKSPQEYSRYQLLPEDHLVGGIDAFKIEEVKAVLAQVQPEAVINAIGIVKQRDEAKQAIPSIQINALFPHLLAQACIEREVRLVHISTDCVFSGERGGYTEADIPDPVDLYGRSKLLGEVQGTGCLTLRTSIVGWELSGHSSLLEWFAAQRGRIIKGYQQAIFTGFPSSVLANLIGDLVETRSDLHGLYHVASNPISKYALLVRLRDALGWDDIVIRPDAQFHCDRSLLAARFERTTGWLSPDWDAMIDVLAREWPVYQAWR
jgi:dTDP-4-dehydrorhamnose reductase